MTWIAGIVAFTLLLVLYFPSLILMAQIWVGDENYGHGIFIPLISLYLIWQQRTHLLAVTPGIYWPGLILFGLGLTFFLIGELTTLYIVVWLSFWLMLMGLVITYIGLNRAKVIWFPLLYLLFMIPLPQFIFRTLSQELQLISSSLGVGCLQIVGVTAFQEGNVIDLGPIQLQVAEACSGIRYLLPLMALSLLCAYLFREAMWKRVCLFLSSIPISILLNGFRIGIIGILVEWYGKEPAEGFYHLFEGWVIFLVSLGILFLEAMMLSRIGRRKTSRHLLDQFGLEAPPLGSELSPTLHTNTSYKLSPSTPFTITLVLLVPIIFVATKVEARMEVIPQRQALFEFPMKIGEWTGNSFAMEQMYLEKLKLDDYLLADFYAPHDSPINLYVAYYDSQKKGRSAHSPRSCIPSDGWEIVSIKNVKFPDSEMSEHAMNANLVTIQKGEQRQLVMYWFQQRGRTITNEYMVKLYLLWDALTQNRTDGALVRLIADMKSGRKEHEVQTDLLQFASLVKERLPEYVPN